MGKPKKKQEAVIATPTTDFSEVVQVTGIEEGKLRMHLEGRKTLPNKEQRAVFDAIGGKANIHTLAANAAGPAAPRV